MCTCPSTPEDANRKNKIVCANLIIWLPQNVGKARLVKPPFQAEGPVRSVAHRWVGAQALLGYRGQSSHGGDARAG